MGWSYAHIALFGPKRDRVISALGDRRACISPTSNGYTLVADHEFESHDEERMVKLAAELSGRLACVALLIREFDDDVLNYELLENGVLTDRYNSEPDYFDFAWKHIPPRGPQGGDARRLCAALNQPYALLAVEKILHEHEMGLSAPDRHAALAKVLGMPSYSVGFDYTSLEAGEFPEDLNAFEVKFIGDDSE